MPFQPSKKATLLMPSGPPDDPDRLHLWIVLTDPCADHEANLVVNVCTLRDDVLFLREDTIVLFDLSLSYENGRLPRTDEEPLPMVQLRGSGSVAFDVIERLRTIDVTTARPATIRGQSVVGWMGRILPRAIPVAEAPAGQRGLLSFAGDGMIFMVGK